MKKLLLILLAGIFCLRLEAQVEEPVDFTFTNALNGETMSLFEILAGGQYVYLEFFRTTCPYCQQAAPLMAEAYHALGCNQHQIFIIGISSNDTPAALQQWATAHGADFPLVTYSNLYNYYGVEYQPWGILIAPDTTMVSNDLNPSYLYEAAVYYGIEPAECPASVSIDEVASASAWAIYPNPVDDVLHISGAGLSRIEVFNAFGQCVEVIEAASSEVTLSVAGWRAGVYFVTVNGAFSQKFVKM